MKDAFGDDITVDEIDGELAKQAEVGVIESWVRFGQESTWQLLVAGRVVILDRPAAACGFLAGAAAMARWAADQINRQYGQDQLGILARYGHTEADGTPIPDHEHSPAGPAGCQPCQARRESA